MANNLLDKSSIILTPTAYNNGEALCVKPSDGSGDFDFSRNSAATRVNAQGLVENVQSLGSELVTNGTFDTDLSGWSSITNVTWSSNFGGSAFMNAVGTNAQFRQTISYEVGKTYRISWEVKENNGCDFFRVYNNNSYTNITDNYIGTHYFDFTHTSGLNFILRNDRVGSDITIDNVSVKEVIDNTNLPRINYENFSFDGSGNIIPNSGCGSWLFEPQSTNLIPYSEDFSQWDTIGSPTITSNFGISPDGTQNADRVQMNIGDRLFESSTTPNVSFSVYAKSNSGLTHTINMRDGGGVVTYDMVITDKWQRFDVYLNTTMSNVQFRAYEDNIDVLFWGAQVEALSYASSLIPTSGSQVTRNQDLCTNGGSLATINSTEGVLYAEIAALANDGTKRYISLSDGTNANDVRLYFDTNGYISVLSKVGGSTQSFINSNAYTQTDFNKVAFKYKENDFALWINGVEVGTDNLGSVNAANTLNELAFFGNNLPFFGKTKALAVFPYLSDQELTELTTI